MKELDHKIIENEGALKGYFEQFSKPKEAFRVGLEAEFLGIDDSGKALPYFGAQGIEAILTALAERFGYAKIMENEHVIGLNRKDLVVSLEPGGQVELSAPPVSNVFEIQDQINAFISQLKEISRDFPGIRWLAAGMHPFSSLDEIEWVPKTRYEIMSAYMKEHGSESHSMMKLTATNQINVDYCSEENAMTSLRVALGITSIVTAMFAHSSFSNGKPNGFISKRIDIWNHTDPSRTGLLVEFTKPGRTFDDYLEYLLEMPMIFMIRNEQWQAVRGVTFRQFIQRGYQGTRATFGDFELHLGTAFPEARLKQYLEVRGVDCQEPALIPAVGAFWKGILYDEATAKQAWDLVSFASADQRLELHQSVAKLGLQAQFGGKPVLDYARELVELSCRSLGKQKKAGEDRDECVFLERIREKIIRPGKSPAAQVLEKWNGDFGRDPQKLLDYLSI